MKKIMLLLYVFYFFGFTCTAQTAIRNKPVSRVLSKNLVEKVYKAKRSKLRQNIRKIKHYTSLTFTSNNEDFNKSIKKIVEKNAKFQPLVDEGDLPMRSLLRKDTAIKYISDYYQNNTNIGYPVSFIMTSIELQTYLNVATSKSDNNNFYLQFYMGYNLNLNMQFTCVISSLKYNMPIDGNNTLSHDSQCNHLFGNCVPCPQCGVVIDDLDALIPNPNGIWNPAIQSSTLDKSIGQSWISTYQYLNLDTNPNSRTQSSNPTSMYINATLLKDFLNNNNNVKYLQIYLGFKNVNDSLTFIIVGVDNTGNHVYDNTRGGELCVFEECNPCPTCNITADPLVDGPIAQFIGQHN